MSISSVVPAPAAAVGYNVQTFGSAITIGGNWQETSGAIVSQNADGSVTIAGGNNAYNSELETAHPGSNGSFTGEAFGGGGYFQATLSFTGAPSTSGGWPAFWSNDIEMQSGNPDTQWQGQPSGYSDWLEPDFMEFLTGSNQSYGGAIHNWYGQLSNVQDTVTGNSSGSPFKLPAGTDVTQPHTYGFLWVPATATTQGYAKWFFDGVQVGRYCLTWYQYNPAALSPPVDGSTAYSVMDTRHLYLILGTGPSNPMTVYSASVWQNSSANDIGTLQTPIVNPPQPPIPNPPDPVTPSPDGTKITSATASPIIDQAGNSWTLVQSASQGLQIACNGVVDPVTAQVVLLETLGGKIVQENSFGDWFSEPGANGPWSQIAALSTPPVPPVLPVPSPDGTKITTAAASPIIDQAGNSWTLVQSASKGLQIACNGVVDPVTAQVVLLETLGGKIVQENSFGDWFSEPGANGPWSQIAALSTPPVPPVLPVPSPDGTKITTAAASPIIDQAGNSWTLVQSASQGLQIACNGVVDPVTAQVVLLETLGGKIVQENSFGDWFSEPGANGPWSQIAAPVTPPPVTPPAPVTTGTGSDTLVLSMSEDSYANGDGKSDANGDAAFTVSVDGKQLAGTFYATALHSAGASQNFTFKGDWAPGAHTVAVAFLNDAYAGTPSTDRNLYVNDLTYDGTDTKQSAALMSTGSKSFTVTDSTAIPSPVIGSGSDTLVLKVSEDAYKGNAQFTVSVDGKQLGGTLTATTLHASGASQSFAFAGDFGSGQHTVSVNFINDAWAGTAATDRNLYVNDIVYNGTDTGLSAPLMGNGAKTFAVSGGTPPSVSESGDHGSLQKTLSQTGTYTVGGDTFVLASGNAAAVTLGTGVSQIKFIGPTTATLTGGAGQATVTADMGSNKFIAGAGSLDVTGGGGKDAYVFHATSGRLTLEDFSLAKGDTLSIDKSLQGSLHQTSDGVGGTMLSFGSNGQYVDLHGLVTMPGSNILWA